MMITNKVYDSLKKMSMIVLPIIGALIFLISLVLGKSVGFIIVGIMMCVLACLGIFLEVLNRDFNSTVEDFEPEPMLCDMEAD